MTFFALLTKELRLRLRSERTVWVMVIYILLLFLLGWFYLANYGNNVANLNQVGITLYIVLSLVQLALLIFITPAFTATAINSEKERQTFDLLLCSRLSSFSLVAGKMVAGLTNSLLLIAASIPVFSLVLFFGGIEPKHMLLALIIYVATAMLVSAFGLFCSIVFKRPAISTSITYVVSLAWLLGPVAIALLFTYQTFYTGNSVNTTTYLFIWNPGMALVSMISAVPNYTVGPLSLSPWFAYMLLSLIATVVFLLLSMFLVKPRHIGLRGRRSRTVVEEVSAA